MQKHKYGEANNDIDDLDDKNNLALQNMTPNTKKRTLIEQEKTGVKKLGDFATFFSLLKGMVCTGVIYLPRNLYNGGWAFSLFALVLAYALTLFCSIKLVQAQKASGIASASFTQLGEKAMGKLGRRLVELSLFFSQVGLVCAYIAFICTSMVSIVLTTTGHHVSPWWFGGLLFVLYTPLCLIRKIEVLAPTHIFADIMIVVTLTTLMVYGGLYLNKHPWGDVPAINGPTFLDAIGSAVYSYEGIGVVLPIYEVTKNPEKISANITIVITVVLALYIVFGFFMLFAYGAALKHSPIITETITQLEQDDYGKGYVDYVLLVIKVLFSLNLIFSYPLVIYPAHIVIEENLYAGWPKSRRRQMFKNLNRTLLVLFTVIVSVLMADQLDKFLAVLGALGCTPITFTLPTLFHLYLCKPTGKEKILDLFVIGVSCVILVFCTGYSIYVWAADKPEPHVPPKSYDPSMGY